MIDPNYASDAQMDEIEDDGQPTEYEEWQDLPWGGDDDFYQWEMDCDW